MEWIEKVMDVCWLFDYVEAWVCGILPIVYPDTVVVPMFDFIIGDFARVWVSVRAIINNKGVFVSHLTN